MSIGEREQPVENVVIGGSSSLTPLLSIKLRPVMVSNCASEQPYDVRHQHQVSWRSASGHMALQICLGPKAGTRP